MTVFSQYQNASYDDAINSAKRYIKLFPNAPDLPYAYYLEGMSYYNQIPDISRDQGRAPRRLRSSPRSPKNTRSRNM